MIIGLCGPKGSGKSELAKQLKLVHGWTIGDLAAPIKLMEEALLRYQGVSEVEIQRIVYGPDRDTEEIPELGYQTSRHCQITLGTEWGRELMADDLWIGALERHIKVNQIINLVIENIRFLNEAEMVRHFNGKIALIQREGYKPSLHVSEREYLLIDHDLTIYNDSTPEHMLQQLEKGLKME